MRPGTPGGQRIGPYMVGKTLGVGSTGRVKLGSHIETGHKVGIKIIPKEAIHKEGKEGTGGLNKKLEREITIMKLIQHPNVLQLYDVYETDKELFLILEFVEGGELFDYLVKKGRLSESEALSFFQQIMFGIDFCHRYLICHRDLKPENLLLDRDLNVKIADFGMASLQVPSKMLETSCGSPHYASPEIIKGIKYDGAAADIWSCGVILYALLTGNLPFDDENIRRLLSKVKSGVYVIPEHVSDDAKDLIRKMLQIKPGDRITMRDIFRHPWFTSRPPKNPSVMNYNVDEVKLQRPIDDLNDIEPDILNSLSLLGWGNEEELLNALQAKE
ncbi:kinase-like domain-containing protein [Gaertneriomyces semiglobifer]|nr:kinase-like domain-containing protein [Gaertneriomyces semiglobifer]